MANPTLKVGEVLSAEPFAAITHIERSPSYGHTTWLAYAQEVGACDAEYFEATVERILGLPEDMPVDWPLTPRDDIRIDQGVYRTGAGLATSYEVMKLSENGKLTPAQVEMYEQGTHRSYRAARRQAREIARGSYKSTQERDDEPTQCDRGTRTLLQNQATAMDEKLIGVNTPLGVSGELLDCSPVIMPEWQRVVNAELNKRFVVEDG